MSEDTQGVQNQEPVSPKEPVSTDSGTSQDGVTQQTPPPEDVVKDAEAKMTELIQQKVAEEIKKATETSRREIQSAKDKARAEVDSAMRRAKLAEGTLDATRRQLQGLDPDVAKDVEIAELRAREQGRATIEQEQEQGKLQAEFHQRFQSGLSQFITALGIDPKDERIDWATDAPDYLEAQNRVLDSVSKIQKENIQTLEKGLNDRLKAIEDKVKQSDTEANSVDTTTSGGVAAGSDAEFVKQFGTGDVPLTKANVDRYNKIINSE